MVILCFDKLHCTTLPAVVYTDGTMSFYEHDRLHRETGPARIVWAENRQKFFAFWFQYGELQNIRLHNADEARDLSEACTDFFKRAFPDQTPPKYE